MEDALARLMAPRRGHFQLASGDHGDLWLDLDGLFSRPSRLSPFIEALAAHLTPYHPDAICGPATGGAYLSLLLATALDAAFVPATPTAALLERRVAVVDDVINAGSAVRTTLREVRAAGGIPVVLTALLVLGSPAAELAAAEGIDLVTLGRLPAGLWPPSACPLCAAGQPLEPSPR